MKLTLEGHKREQRISEPRELASVTEKRSEITKAWLQEIDGYYLDMAVFGQQEADEIFMKLSAWTARASHIRSQINRSESKVLQNFRIKQIDPFLEECDRQFKVWSRAFAVQSLDWNLQRGQV